MTNYQFEKNKLYDYLGGNLIELLKKYNMYIAGGTITSLFSNSEINDLDVYAPNEESAIAFLHEAWEDKIYIDTVTSKAVQFMYDGKCVQLIHFHYFEKPTDIFNTFDFTVCMGVFDFKTEDFVLHDDFMKHNSQRILKFNSETAYPIISSLRIQKYEDKGYSISKAEFVRVVMTCMKLEINTYTELKNHLGGLYGINMDKLFEDVANQEFDLQTAIDKIADITLSDDYFTKPASIEWKDINEILAMISKKPSKYITINGITYLISVTGELKVANSKAENHIDIEVDTFVNDLKIYKFVEKRDNGLFSYYDKKFEYKVGEQVIPKNNKLWFNFKSDIKSSSYYNNKNSVLIEATIPNEKALLKLNDHVTVSEAFILREVPESEWKEWIAKPLSFAW
ncbi:hypothetical protein [Psychrobacillus phage Perkons]|nr:hypothetical protein [Psychrobacillus phage Perkons]